MATLNPDHLLAQAERLIRAPPAGPPLQVDVRRAISAAYYSVFHAVLTAAATRSWEGRSGHPRITFWSTEASIIDACGNYATLRAVHWYRPSILGMFPPVASARTFAPLPRLLRSYRRSGTRPITTPASSFELPMRAWQSVTLGQRCAIGTPRPLMRETHSLCCFCSRHAEGCQCAPPPVGNLERIAGQAKAA
jgi:hypothetical protein